VHVSWYGTLDFALGMALYMNYVEVQRQYFSPQSKSLSFDIRGLPNRSNFELTVCGIYDEGKLGPPSTILPCSTTT